MFHKRLNRLSVNGMEGDILHSKLKLITVEFMLYILLRGLFGCNQLRFVDLEISFNMLL